MTPKTQFQSFLSIRKKGETTKSGAHTQEKNQIGGHLSAPLRPHPPQTRTQDSSWPQCSMDTSNCNWPQIQNQGLLPTQVDASTS